MKYAVVDGRLTHISKVAKGTIAKEFGYSHNLVVACVGQQRKYWKSLDMKKAQKYSHLLH